MKDEQYDILNMTMVDMTQAVIDKPNNKIKHMAIMADVAMDTNGNVFRKFTDNALNNAVSIFNGALARLDHDRDNQSKNESRGVRTGFGVYQNIQREGNKIFGDLCLWDCEAARKVMSIAERTPNAVGNSIHAGGMGKEVDGIEIIEQLMPRTKYGFKPSIDLVDDPAATTGIFQNKPNLKEKNEMEFKDLTQELLKTNRPDLEKHFMDAGKAARNDEVKKLEQDKIALEKTIDEMKVKQAAIDRDVLAAKLVKEAKMPEYAVTDAFMSQLKRVEETKVGDKVISVEDGIKSLIQDRLNILDPGGVKGNGEDKDLKQSKGKVSDDVFVNTFKS